MLWGGCLVPSCCVGSGERECDIQWTHIGRVRASKDFSVYQSARSPCSWNDRQRDARFLRKVSRNWHSIRWAKRGNYKPGLEWSTSSAHVIWKHLLTCLLCVQRCSLNLQNERNKRVFSLRKMWTSTWKQQQSKAWKAASPLITLWRFSFTHAHQTILILHIYTGITWDLMCNCSNKAAADWLRWIFCISDSGIGCVLERARRGQHAPRHLRRPEETRHHWYVPQ